MTILLKMPKSVFRKKRKIAQLITFQATVNNPVINWQSEFLILLQKAINLRTILSLKQS